MFCLAGKEDRLAANAPQISVGAATPTFSRLPDTFKSAILGPSQGIDENTRETESPACVRSTETEMKSTYGLKGCLAESR